jgi:hypothetical protein
MVREPIRQVSSSRGLRRENDVEGEAGTGCVADSGLMPRELAAPETVVTASP